MDAQNNLGDIKARVLVVDDEAAICLLLVEWLNQAGFSCQSASSTREALGILEQQEFDAIISDLRMPGPSGLALLETVRAKYPKTAFLLATGGGDVQAGIEAKKQGASDYLVKPFRLEAVLAALQQALEKKPE